MSTHIKEALEKINAGYSNAIERGDSGTYWQLSTLLQQYEAGMREYIQHATKDQIQRIIKKLKHDQDLEILEIEYIKMWIVGDADYYVKMENNYNDWVEELKRLIDELNKLNEENPQFETAAKIRAMSLDAIRVLGDIAFFLKQKDRIKNFDESTKVIDPKERDLLIDLLEGKLDSPNE